MPVGARTDFVYGNTRLRARRGALLGQADYEGLLGKDLDRLLGALADTEYRAEIEAALTPFHGLRRLHEALRAHLARSLREMQGFYEGDARGLVDLLLSRWDLHNLLALVRGGALSVGPERILALIVPVGGIDEAAAEEIAEQPDLGATVRLLVSWRLPDPQAATDLELAYADYEIDEDLATLEGSLSRHHAARAVASLAGAGPDAAALRDVVAREVDARNVLTALRLRAAYERGELNGSPALDQASLLPGGRAAAERLESAIRAATSASVATELAAAAGVAGWRAPLERWGRGGDLVGLQRELEEALTREAVGLFAAGDPLGVAIPVAYAAAIENEARNLRAIGEEANQRADPEVVRPVLVIP